MMLSKEEQLQVTTDMTYSYDEAVSYILEIPRFLSKNSPEDTREFLKLVDQESYGAIVFHVAGTNGKGSVCAFLNSTCEAMGLSRGVFTSPHLECIRERIQIDNEMVDEEEFLQSFQRILQLIAVFNERREQKYHPSFFEYLFFMSRDIFNKKHVDVQIYETGLGGRLDATNSLPGADACIITSIGMDHMEYLGNTVEEIAGEKAGIIKWETPVIFLKNQVYSQVISDKADSMNSPKIMVDSPEVEILIKDQKNIDFCYDSRYYSSVNLTCHTRAIYQAQNCALALSALECVFGDRLTLEQIKTGVANMRWPGRMEQLEEQVWIDGGHNVEGVQAFLESVKRDGVTGDRFLVYSGVSDKQIDRISRLITDSNLFASVAVCPIQSDRGVDCKVLGQYFEGAKVYESAQDALWGEKAKLGNEDRVYICGSLYLVGEIKSIYHSMQ